MQAKPEYRDRDDAEVAVLDALADRGAEGMTIFELRSHVDQDIDTIESALAELKSDGLITADDDDNRTVIIPDEDVIGPDEPEDESVFDQLRRKLPF
jgi:predicted transcriptional regulator